MQRRLLAEVRVEDDVQLDADIAAISLDEDSPAAAEEASSGVGVGAGPHPGRLSMSRRLMRCSTTMSLRLPLTWAMCAEL